MSPGPGSRRSADRGEVPIQPLACGRDAAVVWDRAAAGTPLDEHERGCPHCTAASADARSLESVVHRMAAQELEPPRSVLDRVMGAVLTDFRNQDVLTLPSSHGPARLSRPAAATVLRHTVDRMTGLRARSCRIDQHAEPGAPPHAATVTMTVTARFGVDLASITARVRQMVLAAGEQALGLPVVRVDIEVVDVYGGGPP